MEIDNEPLTPPVTKHVIELLQPRKSARKYIKEFKLFKEWIHVNNYKITESSLLLYSENLSKKFSPPTVRSKISMIKKELLINGQRLDSDELVNLHVKRLNTGHICKKAAVFTQKQLEFFLEEALDVEYLMMKFILLIGFFGFSRSGDLWTTIWNDITLCDEGVKFSRYNSVL